MHINFQEKCEKSTSVCLYQSKKWMPTYENVDYYIKIYRYTLIHIFYKTLSSLMRQSM